MYLGYDNPTNAADNQYLLDYGLKDYDIILNDVAGTGLQQRAEPASAKSSFRNKVATFFLTTAAILAPVLTAGQSDVPVLKPLQLKINK